MDEIMKIAINQGLGYAMFVFLLLYVLKTTGERENKYQETIDKLADKISIVENIERDVKEIKNKVK